MHTSTPAARARHGFTVLELMVTVAIIIVLVGMILAGAMRLRQRARQARDSVEKTSLAAAIRGYKLEYGYWPCPDRDAGGSWTADNGNIITNYLLPSSPGNPRRIGFWEQDGPGVDFSNHYYRISIDPQTDEVKIENTTVAAP